MKQNKFNRCLAAQVQVAQQRRAEGVSDTVMHFDQVVPNRKMRRQMKHRQAK